MNTTANYGGVTYKDVIAFQTKILFGRQFGRIAWAKEQGCISEDIQNEILVACLRLGWSDAFRHTSKNKDGVKDKVEKYEKNEKYKTVIYKIARGEKVDKKIGADFDDYFCAEVISKTKFLHIFKEYAAADDKSKIIDDKWDTIRELFENIKELEGDKALSLGHIQKMFNIAIKLYLCLYICRQELGLDDGLFVKKIVNSFDKAHCPVDSIILGKRDQNVIRKWDSNGPAPELLGENTWSQLNKNGYDKIQDEIAKECNGRSNLWYDFENWN